eukprot:CAMPEP_0119307680 /NCGR_PEP_ID=MMETSP1333-20130426/8104_1 /TAXON_ID=418940 /ORGANISM="Scyphosphaera apsteinii, Strain RCC1455" /LENGTH=304 /DNA_ID=CAMNT_0007311275 /DNA_START=49 /DNA_END=960 /DNA_ORIENTATION=-
MQKPELTSVVFFATHELPSADATLLRWYVKDIESSAEKGRAEFWTLLYRGPASWQESQKEIRGGGEMHEELEQWRAATGTQICEWDETVLHVFFPRLEYGLATNPAFNRTRHANLKRYFYFHASLMVWFASYGQQPRFLALKYLWRLEPDVLYSGRISALIGGMANVHADVLLPKLISWERNSDYTHWKKNAPFLKQVPPNKWVWSLVSIGRYSTTFIQHKMAPQWAAGIVAYEEISLPVTCLKSADCTLKPLGTSTKPHVNMSQFRFRPEHNCSDFLAAVQASRFGLWHPVKERECYVQYLSW